MRLRPAAGYTLPENAVAAAAQARTRLELDSLRPGAASWLDPSWLLEHRHQPFAMLVSFAREPSARA